MKQKILYLILFIFTIFLLSLARNEIRYIYFQNKIGSLGYNQYSETNLLVKYKTTVAMEDFYNDLEYYLDFHISRLKDVLDQMEISYEIDDGLSKRLQLDYLVKKIEEEYLIVQNYLEIYNIEYETCQNVIECDTIVEDFMAVKDQILNTRNEQVYEKLILLESVADEFEIEYSLDTNLDPLDQLDLMIEYITNYQVELSTKLKENDLEIELCEDVYDCENIMSIYTYANFKLDQLDESVDVELEDDTEIVDESDQQEDFVYYSLNNITNLAYEVDGYQMYGDNPCGYEKICVGNPTNMYTLINQFRTNYGINALEIDSNLEQSSLDWSGYMYLNGFMVATDEQMQNSIFGNIVGENILYDYEYIDSQQAMSSFKNSQTQYQNLITEGYNKIGVGIIYIDSNQDGIIDLTYITQRFAI